jgi:predicted nucleic acid-binding protein
VVRSQAVKMVQAIMADPNVTVVPQSRASFLEGLGLYARRTDKDYSLVDCSSMEAMRGGDIQEVLTNDGHFSQEGFTVLIQP